MAKNKGYQKEGKHDYFNHGISYAGGKNKSIQDIIDDNDKSLKLSLSRLKKAYEIAEEYGITNTTLRKKYSLDHNTCSIDLLEFDWDYNSKTYLQLLPYEVAKKNVINRHHRCNNIYSYQKRIVNKDNQKFVYNSGSGSSSWPIVRIPSLKRSKQVWKRFYELFPRYEEMSHDPELRKRYSLKKI